jgi:hypothetical protein
MKEMVNARGGREIDGKRNGEKKTKKGEELVTESQAHLALVAMQKKRMISLVFMASFHTRRARGRERRKESSGKECKPDGG